MTHPMWGCAVPKCKECDIEKIKAQMASVEKTIATLESMSTGWKMYTGIKIGYKLSLDILTK